MASALRRGALTQAEGQRVSSALEEFDSAAAGAEPYFAALRALTAAFPNTPCFLYLVDPNTQDNWFCSNFTDENSEQSEVKLFAQICNVSSSEIEELPPLKAKLETMLQSSVRGGPYLLCETPRLATELLTGALLAQPATPSDRAVLSALQTPLNQWSAAAHALALYSPATSLIFSCLNAFEQAAFVFDPNNSRLILANRVAQQLRIRPDFLRNLTARQLPRNEQRAEILRHARITPLLSAGLELWLIVCAPSLSVVPAPLTSPLPSLPPTLGQTALLLCQGASDKEIAHTLGVEHSTARTYTSRVLKKLKLSGRRELMQRFVPEDFASSTHPPSSGIVSKSR